MEFEKRKASALAAIASEETDKSPKGTLDTPIIPLIRALNQHSSYFTTSSCSGRISILSQPSQTTSSTSTTTTTAIKKKKARGGSWLFITHDPADPDSVVDLLFGAESTRSEQQGELVFRFEPFILAVECKDISSAQSLVSTAISCGFRESGITNVQKRIIIAVRCSIRLEVPLGETGRIMVSPEYVPYLVGIANEKMEMNRKRTEAFLQVLQSRGLSGPTQPALESQKYTLASEDCGVVDEPTIDSAQLMIEDCNAASTDADTQIGLSRDTGCSISVTQVVIVGEPVEKLFLWGHSACTLNNTNHTKILVFGGFGGLGRHARRNESLVLEPFSGILNAINVEELPSPRLGHTSSVIGQYVFIIGGRGDPTKILDDVWVLDTDKNKWTLLECNGNMFYPRQRHAAAAVGSKIYVFGGLNNEVICSSMHILDMENSRWSDISISGEWPCARHSHSLVAKGSQLFMFGGYDGEKPLGDLYSFDTKTCLWKKEKTAGRAPHSRFSHSMFVYKNYLGIIGGCPVRQHYQEVALLDLHSRLWKFVMLDSLEKCLFVRSTVNIVGDDLVVIGGGASCYAFGTRFTEPMKMSLLPLISPDNVIFPSDLDETAIKHQPEEAIVKNNDFLVTGRFLGTKFTENSYSNYEPDVVSVSSELQMGAKHWVLQLGRKYAKLGKDILKKFGWLDLGRKVYSCEDELLICLPITEKFCALFNEKEHDLRDALGSKGGLHSVMPSTEKGVLINELSCPMALNFLLACGGSILKDEVVRIRKSPRSPLKIMSEAVSYLLKDRGLPQHLLEQLPIRWERLGDIVVLPVSSFKDPAWNSIGDELWSIVAKSLGARRLARQGCIAPTGTRDSTLEILVGDNGWVDHRENGIIYSFDATKCMFSWGNLSEKLRMACLDCRDKVVVDLFAGIGYFVLPFLVGAKAKLVYACEWNPCAIEALRHNVEANSVADRCIILEGDNRVIAPKGVADRVCLGLLPTSEGSWLTAVRALRSEGGILHIHGNVKDSEEQLWPEHIVKSISEIVKSEGYCWEVSIQHVERVKWYGPHIRHLVADVRCKTSSM
ncbi:tRNA wybutosine-synthesizing protein 2/3/4 isoform X2 [Macadamia integrifolia]|uniref:tRNA wybutosine-synthesizing protein 2/3/4 isoform X2 n=1 Tax=Macadamia integrifolia TaxID=60698 RepID=UPI001C5320A4|nr:tRNA wybutosine-synthesizing protein 2/3/4 isoform X2 [Macadamia integrifolia]